MHSTEKSKRQTKKNLGILHSIFSKCVCISFVVCIDCLENYMGGGDLFKLWILKSCAFFHDSKKKKYNSRMIILNFALVREIQYHKAWGYLCSNKKVGFWHPILYFFRVLHVIHFEGRRGRLSSSAYSSDDTPYALWMPQSAHQSSPGFLETIRFLLLAKYSLARCRQNCELSLVRGCVAFKM